MKCRRCKIADSTGEFIHLCDACFEWFDAKTKSVAGKYELADSEVEYFDESVRTRVVN